MKKGWQVFLVDIVVVDSTQSTAIAAKMPLNDIFQASDSYKMCIYLALHS